VGIGDAQVAVAEPLVWRMVECVQRLDLRGAAAAAGGGGGGRVAAATDTPLAISLMAVADLTAYVRRALRRPLSCGAAGQWSGSAITWAHCQHQRARRLRCFIRA